MSKVVIHFLAMGGYAEYVWLAYGLGMGILIGNFMHARYQYKKTKRACQ